ncbi:dynein heavy chain, putative [Bodo saltans]|uniref:Dynein-1, subspecies f n=1 Tax=Bodo saltans TaxID=75058 RepID=A0A0S4IXG4_BODSA|nr:dynein heavy chain, putative [Bodo saltans]|eukprot:CUG06458.1 dynein heavy chain, putative [Bodo saltans]
MDFDNIEAETHPECLQWVVERLTENLYIKPDLFTNVHKNIATDFLVGDEKKRAMFAFLSAGGADDSEVTLKLSIGHPNLSKRKLLKNMNSDVIYFVRMDPKKDVTPENVDVIVSWGVSKGGQAMDTFLRTMQHVLAPTLLRNRGWPDSIQKDFSSVMHKFMATLTENANRMKGNTVLYVPLENLSEAQLKEAHLDKELVQRFESAVIHWTRQIREVVNEKDVDSAAESEGPLAEIDYWRARTKDLSNIRKQFGRKDVTQIVDVLQEAKSFYYLEPFLALRADIENGTEEAIDNLRYLNTLVEPCTRLTNATPQEIPGMVKEILRTVQLILIHSKHYKKERFFRLLRMISNEIVNRCRKKIDLQAIFDGRVEQSMIALQESIEAGEAWIHATRKMLSATQKRFRTEKAEQLDLDDTVLNEIDGFVKHRCNNLQEVCKGQLQFGFKVYAADRASHTEEEQNAIGAMLSVGELPGTKEASSVYYGLLPCFGGSKGPEIESQLLDIQRSFKTKMDTLRHLNYDILDVKATKWSDDFRALKGELDNLGTMMQQIISAAFDNVATVESGVEHLEAFFYLAKREELYRQVDRSKERVVRLFSDELKAVQNDMQRYFSRTPPILYLHPPLAGQGFWARNFIRRIEGNYRLLSRCYYLQNSADKVEAMQLYHKVEKTLDENVKRHYRTWKEALPATPADYLDTFLISRRERENDSPKFNVNFATELLLMFEEARYWQRLGEPIPAQVADIMTKEERLRVFRENVALAVRAYNNIVGSLNAEERRLFAFRVQFLESKYQPGLNKLWWSSQGIVEYFVRECRTHADKLQTVVDEFKYGVQYIEHHCTVLAETLVVSIEKKKVYEIDAFEDRQKTHRGYVQEKIVHIHQNILKMMRKLFDFFRNDYANERVIQVEWHRFVEKIEKWIEDALKAMVKRSLHEIERALPHHKDEEKTEEQVFKLDVMVATQNETKPTIETRPLVATLGQRVNHVGKEIIGITQAIPRLEEALSNVINSETESELEDKKLVRVHHESPNPDTLLQGSYHEFMTGEQEAIMSLRRIRDAFDSISDKIKDKLNQTWQLHQSGPNDILWATAKQDKRIKQNWKLDDYKANIDIIKSRKNTINNQEPLADVLFIQLDFSKMKETVRRQCEAVIKQYHSNLYKEAKEELEFLYKSFTQTVERLSREPKTLDQLGEQMNHCAKAFQDLAYTEARFEPLRQKFELLMDKESGNSADVMEEDIKKKDDLVNAFEDYKNNLGDAKKKLDKFKEQFKSDLETDLRSFQTACEQLRKDIGENGPYSYNTSASDAFNKLQFYRRQVQERRNQEAGLQQGMEIFKIDRPPQQDLRDAEAEIELLHKIWTICDRWRTETHRWNTQHFMTLNGDQMAEAVETNRKEILRLRKELERREVWSRLREDIELFKRVLPVVDDLLIRAIRPRHWDQLKNQLDHNFDISSETFCLQELLEVHVERQAEFVSNLSTAARQELKIEEDLEKIKDMWESQSLVIESYQSYFKIAGTDDIANVLAEHLTMLSSMKMSRFVDAFRHKVQHWEQSLSLVTDTLESLLNVQTKWMYLENIFVGSEDIKRKLVAESKQFDAIHNQWLSIVGRLHSDPNVIRGTRRDGLLEQLNNMATGLEHIQKSLEGFLEDRRRAFPRFYFLSNDDLLEILGHTKDPEKVQAHLRKCFEGLFALTLKPVRQKIVADAMHSADGEKVPFVPAVPVEGLPVEVWLKKVEDKMRETVQSRLNATLDDLVKKVYQPKKPINRDLLKEWIEKNEGQCLITAASINWTRETERVITEYGDLGGGGRRKDSPVYKMYKKWKSLIKKYCYMVRQPQDKFQRNKLVALITIEVHARDILRSLQLAKVSSKDDFDWSKQLRFYRETDTNEKGDESQICVIRQASACVKYDYEYLGNSGRLVVTGLTDRAYMTLTTALQLFRGGLPQGPAGTGKTETVKDLGKGIAKYVMVFNCSDGLDFKSLGRMLSGIAQTGGWSCFDEFNRIEVEVLSVVAQQILSILNAVAERKKNLIFEGVDIPLNVNCGIFVTMNPGYAGRSELPDNLKALLRPISMMQPDFALICEITLLSQGFEESEPLSKKVAILYELMEKQLSKQDHYDFSLRNIKAVLVQAGNLKRENFPGTEPQLCLKAMMDMNLPKFVKDDVPLFMSMLGDLFPGIQPEDAGLDALKDMCKLELAQKGLEVNEHILVKVLHLWDTLRTRHGVMVVGQTGSGKTVTWQTLCGALKRLKEANAGSAYEPVKVQLLNPKSVTMDELYGSYNQATREWKDGILSDLMRQICRDIKDPTYKWLLFDGPVDTLWIESMNTVLDDNKMLTLNSGERINLNPTISMVFEVQDLSQASPATVSRCGMVFFNVEDLGWRPFVTTWLKSRKNYEVAVNAPKPETTINEIEDFIFNCMPKALEYKRRECVELFTTTDINNVRSFTTMFDALANPEAAPVLPGGAVYPTAQAGDNYIPHIKLVAMFSLLWSVGGTLTVDSRRKFDALARELDGSFPSSETSFEYFPDFKSHSWKSWDEHPDLQKTFSPDEDTPYYRLMVPTVDTVRYNHIVSQLVRNRCHLVLVGNTGTGKSLIASQIVRSFPSETHVATQLNFSAQTTARNVQEIIEGKMEHKSKKVCGPPGGRRMICLVEDLNMPAKEKFGAQPPLELLRQWLDNGYWYDRTTRARRQVNDMQLLCCMTFGRPDISQRLLSKVNVFNVTFPSETVITKIFSAILTFRFRKFPDWAAMTDNLVKATIQVYTKVTSDLLPIPSKSHYLYNLRDLSKVFQGIYGCYLEALDCKEHIITLWVHECFRVFADRMNDNNDKTWFKNLVCDKLANIFATKWSTLMKARTKEKNVVVNEKENMMFVDFWDGEMDEMAKYKMVPSIDLLKKKVEDSLDNFNAEPGARAMNLVFFTDALEHMCRIHRIIRQPRGNALLVGLGGSGRNSLTRLAAYLAGYSMFSIEIHKKYDSDRFHDDLRNLYKACGGLKQQQKVFYFSDNQVMESSFLEDLNNMLSVGEVPNLFPKDEVQTIKDELRKEAMENGFKDTVDEVYNFFIDRARKNLHLVVAMSPAHRLFRTRLRQFPALVSCTTIDWFVEWPNEALKEVAMRFLAEMNLEGEDAARADAIADMFVYMHDSTNTESRRMADQLKRHNYVTPSSYLDLVRGYRVMLAQKKEIISEQRDKLKNGMTKLEETKVAVGKMTEDLKVQNATLQVKTLEVNKATDDITIQQRNAEEQQALLGSEKIKIEQTKKAALADQAETQVDLDRAMPTLDEATRALDSLDKNDINELKSYKTPAAMVRTVMEAVQTALKRKLDWDEAKKSLSDGQFLNMLKKYHEVNDMTDQKLLNALDKFVKRPEFTPEQARAVSNAAGGLCQWVIAIHKYGNVFKEVHPKMVKNKNAQEKVRAQEEMLRQKEEKLAKIMAEVARLQEALQLNVDEKNRLMREAKETEEKLNRANIIVSGLEGERDRWIESIARYEAAIGNLPGDALLASGFLSYTGAFPTEFRHSLLVGWTKELRRLQLPLTKGFDFVDFLVDPTEVRDWQAVGLPGDDFSKENGVIVTRGTRWPLMIDPQQQANKWIKRLERDNGLKIIDQKQPDFQKTVEYAVQFGCPVLLQDILEEIDPSLDTVVSKAIVRKGNRAMVKIGDNYIEYNDNFRLYITTRLANPHYTPETCTKVCLLNFAVKDKGLEEQLLKIVVQKEKPELEEENEKLILSTAAAKKETKRLEDEILDLLTTSKVSLLENQKLIDTLQSSKVIAVTIAKQLKEAETTIERIRTAREQFRPCAERASILFFVLADLGAIDTMYQFALDSYIILFQSSIKRSAEKLGVSSLEERIKTLNAWHTDQVYNNTCRGLFEKHKLLFSFHMTNKILAARNELNIEEYIFFMKGGQILDKQGRTPNPAPQWLSEKAWDNILELDKLLNFHGIAGSFEGSPQDWKLWFLDERPEEAILPGEWQQKTSESYLQRMLIVRSLRPDRVVFMVYQFIEEKLGAQYVDPPPFNLKDTFEESKNIMPLVFVLSPGVDPTTQLAALAQREGRTLKTLALGQGQGDNAKRSIQESCQTGGWVFLANCHLMVSWLVELEKVIDDMPDTRPHENFRLWLSSVPTPQFPIGILQKAVKMTTEPPTGLKANMVRLYNYYTDEQFLRNGGERPHFYRNLLFSLCYFHSVLLERRKFGTLGYNVVYDFTYSDFEVSENIIKLYCNNMTSYRPEDIPFITIRYLIAEASYGGRVTDDWDRRCINTYMDQFMCLEAITEEHFPLSSAEEYFVPSDATTLQSFKDNCSRLPLTDPPEAFGQHANADIASRIADSNQLLENLIIVNATLARSGGGGGGKVATVEERCLDILSSLDEPSKAAVPALIDYDGIFEATNEDRGDALNTCLLQEIQRYNVLLKKIQRQKAELRRAVKGEIVMNDELDTIFNALLIGRVPPPWTSAYPSTKPLASWSIDLVERIDQMKLWGQRTPKVFWLAGFTYPTGFLKSLQQQQARKEQISIDQYGWEFVVLPSEEKTIMNSAKDGAYVRSIYLEGAGWDGESNCLVEPNPMELMVSMPIIHFRPKRREGKPKTKGIYQCPLYMYPVRTGTRERPSFVVAVDLGSGQSQSDHWVKRGTALLLATDD